MGAAVAIGAGLLSAAGSIMQGNSQAAQYEYQARVAEQNSAVAKAQATESLAEGAREEERFGRRQRQFQANQLTQLAASGVKISGSALNVVQDTAMGIEEDKQQIRYNALKSMWGNEMQATSFLNEANQARAAAGNAKRQGIMGAVGGLLGVGASLYGASHSTYTGGGDINITGGTGKLDPGANTYQPSAFSLRTGAGNYAVNNVTPYQSAFGPGLMNQRNY